MALYGEVGRCVMPLEQPMVIDHYRRVLSVTHGRREKLDHLLRRQPVFRRTWSLSDGISVPHGDGDDLPVVGAELDLISRLLAERREMLLGGACLPPGGELAWLLVTDSRARERRRLTVFVYAAGAAEPAAVIKLQPSETARSGLESEWQALLWLSHRLPTRVGRMIPAPLAWLRDGGMDILVQSYLPGRSLYVDLSRSLVPRFRLRAHFRDAGRWLASLHLSTREQRQRLDAASLRESVVRALGSGAGGAGSQPSWVRRLERLLAQRPLPQSASHGDYWIRNILVLAGGGIGVVDWERFREAALPTDDLFFFPLTYGLMYSWTGSGQRPPLEAFRRTFLDDNILSRRVRTYLREYCQRTKLTPELLEPLFHLYLLTRAPEVVEPAPVWREAEQLLEAAPRSVFQG